MNVTQKRLTIIGSIRCHQFGIIKPLIKALDSGTIIKSRWHDRFRQEHPDMYPLDLSSIKTWSTYRDCVSFVFTMINSKFIGCDAIIWDGDTLNGSKRSIRFSATLKIPYQFLSEIRNEIKAEFESHCEYEYENHLQKEKDEWIKQLKKEIIG